MQRIGFLTVLGLCLLAAGSSRAQVHDGDVRLYLDGTLFSWTKQVTEGEGGGFTAEDETITKSSGLFSGGGAGVGYALSDYLLPELYVALQNSKIENGDTDLTTRQWELRPCLEVPLLPRQRIVPFVMAGMTLGRQITKGLGDSDTDITMFGLGPALGVGAHAFLTERASLDLGLTYRGTFFVKNSLEDDLPDGIEINVKQHALLLTVGASFWL
jgi:Outer membrane protein beta-barrel domain